MPHPCLRLAALALLGAALAAPAAAESLASSASSAGSASSGSVSDSLKGSSNSSSPNKVAEGEYRIDGIAAVAEKPGFVRLTLHHAAQPGTELLLDLPEKTATLAALTVGGRVDARQRPYGIEFAKAAPGREAFFLVLADDWFRELPSRPVSL